MPTPHRAIRLGAWLAPLLVLGSCVPETDRSIEVANLNLLHGFDCNPVSPGTGDQCRLADRVELLFQHLIDVGCPDVVTLQEVVDAGFVLRSSGFVFPLESSVDLILGQLDAAEVACGFRYEVVYAPLLVGLVRSADEELILSRYPVLEVETRPLHSALFDPSGGTSYSLGTRCSRA